MNIYTKYHLTSQEFTAIDRTPFFYIITHLSDGIRYAGIHSKIKCKPDDLGTKYFSSSKIVKQLIKEEGIEAFSFKIRKIFNNVKDCVKYETKFLRKIHAAARSDWYNLHEGNGNFSTSCLIFRDSDKTRQKKSKSKIGKRWINNGTIQFPIDLNDWLFYEQQGFVKGKKKLSILTKQKLSFKSSGRIHIIHTELKIRKFIKSQDWPIFKAQGFVLGRGKRAIEANKKQSETNKNKICIVNKELKICKHIDKQEFETYVALGYVRGGLKNLRESRCWVHSNTTQCLIYTNELDSYINAGFKKGKVPLTLEQINTKRENHPRLEKIWINNGLEHKLIQTAEAIYYISLGYSRGMLKNKSA